MEQITDTIVNTQGKLRILFNKKFLITDYEFTSLNHIEVSPKTPGTFNSQSNVVNEFGITPQLSRSLIVSKLINNLKLRLPKPSRI